MWDTMLFFKALLVMLLPFVQLFDHNCYIWVANEENDDCGCSCLQQTTRWQFLELMNQIPKCSNFAFYLSNSQYHSFPERFFSSIRTVQHFFLEITNLTFSYFPNSKGSMSPFADVIFEVSIYLQLSDIEVRREWNWKAFQALKADKGGTGIFEGYGLKMKRLDQGFSNVLNGSLRSVRFSGGNLKILDDRVFSGLHSLSEVYLHDNEIEEVKRNFFPTPASVLAQLVFKGNKITSLPIDMFIGMPSLKLVDFSQNPLLTLSETVFRPIAASARIVVKDGFHCNCEIRWLKYVLKNAANANFDKIFCETPWQLKDKSLYNVTDEELGC